MSDITWVDAAPATAEYPVGERTGDPHVHVRHPERCIRNDGGKQCRLPKKESR